MFVYFSSWKEFVKLHKIYKKICLPTFFVVK